MAVPPPSLKDEKRALWYLRKIPLLEGLSTDQYRELTGLVEVRELNRRQIVYLPGDPGEHVFFIQGGRIKCSKVSRDGKELTLTYVAAGEFFGELCVLEGQPREEMAEAMKNSIITLLPRERICANLPRRDALEGRIVPHRDGSRVGRAVHGQRSCVDTIRWNQPLGTRLQVRRRKADFRPAPCVTMPRMR